MKKMISKVLSMVLCALLIPCSLSFAEEIEEKTLLFFDDFESKNMEKWTVSQTFDDDIQASHGFRVGTTAHSGTYGLDFLNRNDPVGDTGKSANGTIRSAIVLNGERHLEISFSSWIQANSDTLTLNLKTGESGQNILPLVQMTKDGVRKILGTDRTPTTWSEYQGKWAEVKLIVDLMEDSLRVDLGGTILESIERAQLLSGLNGDLSNLTLEFAAFANQSNYTWNIIRLDDVSVYGLHKYTGDILYYNNCNTGDGWDMVSSIYDDSNKRGFQNITRDEYAGYGFRKDSNSDTSNAGRSGYLVKQIRSSGDSLMVFNLQTYFSGSSILALYLADESISVTDTDFGMYSEAGKGIELFILAKTDGFRKMNGSTDNAVNKGDIGDAWHNIRVILDAADNSYTVYMDGDLIKKIEGANLQKALSGTSFSLAVSAFAAESGRMIIDDPYLYGMGNYGQYLSIGGNSVKNSNKALSIDAVSIAAGYDANECLTDVVINPITVPAGGSAEISMPGGSFSTRSVLIWKNIKSLTPLTENNTPIE